MQSNINFTFVRHGFGCHNAISGLTKSDIISVQDALSFSGKKQSVGKTPMVDPVLTQIGVDASIHNGCVISKILKSIDKILKSSYDLNDNDHDLKIDSIHVIGCSPLIRCMETAYYMTRSWVNPPSKIYVFPFLREIDESSSNKFSLESRMNMNSKPFYAMKDIEEQKKYLERLGILNFFDFSFVEEQSLFQKLRKEPGDIGNFVKWFITYFLEKKQLSETLNVFIVTHAGVLSSFVNQEEGFTNNSGFIINTKYDHNNGVSIKKYVSLNSFLNYFNFYQDYKSTNQVEYYCPSDRCEELCSVAKGKSDIKEIKHIEAKCDINSEVDLPSLLKILNL
jgi:broad specificity phosphatase PhoE